MRIKSFAALVRYTTFEVSPFSWCLCSWGRIFNFLTVIFSFLVCCLKLFTLLSLMPLWFNVEQIALPMIPLVVSIWHLMLLQGASLKSCSSPGRDHTNFVDFKGEKSSAKSKKTRHWNGHSWGFLPSLKPKVISKHGNNVICSFWKNIFFCFMYKFVAPKLSLPRSHEN